MYYFWCYMVFFQHLFFSEIQADLYQSNLQGGKPLRGWVSLSDVDKSQLYKWRRWSGWNKINLGLNKKFCLYKHLHVKNSSQRAWQKQHPTDTERLLPSRILNASSRGQSCTWDPRGACGHPADLLWCLPRAQLTLLARPLWRQELDRATSSALPGVFYLSQHQHLMFASENPAAHLQCHVLRSQGKIIFSLLRG